VELIIEVNRERLMCRRSMERRPVSTGEKMRVLLYRVNVFDEEGAQVLANETLQDVDVEFM